MKTRIIAILSIVWLFIGACTSEQKPAETKLTTEEETAVEEQMKKDQEAMDSLEKAIMNQIDQDTVGI